MTDRFVCVHCGREKDVDEQIQPFLRCTTCHAKGRKREELVHMYETFLLTYADMSPTAVFVEANTFYFRLKEIAP